VTVRSGARPAGKRCGVTMSIALSETGAGIEPSGSHHLSGICSEVTPLYVVCSPRPGVGKTLLSRLLIEFNDVDHRPVTAFDLTEDRPQLAEFLPERAAIVDINDIFGQMGFFDSLISANSTTQVIDLGHRSFRNFFIIAQKIGFFDEVRRYAIEPIILFMVDPDPKSANAYSILQRWFPHVPLLPVWNRAVTEGKFDRVAFPNRGAVPISLEIPALHQPLEEVVEQQSFSFAHFWRTGLERLSARWENELLFWMQRVFSQFRRIERRKGARAPRSPKRTRASRSCRTNLRKPKKRASN
jgi:hypothetical protein